MKKQKSEKSDEKVSNLNYLMETMGGNKELVKEVIEVFLKQVPDELLRINHAIENKDYTTIKNISHSMFSSIVMMGITTLEPLLKEIESLAASSSDIEKIKQLNKQLNTTLKKAINEISNF